MDWPPAQFVDIGDRTVCARAMGQGPVVVLEAGGAGEGTSETYSGTVEEQLAEFATVVTYDRVGSGRSDGKPRETVAQLADDLDALLSAIGCQTPAVIVGWSSGGMVAEMFAVRHPSKVAGLVLLDPTEFASPRFLHDTLSSQMILAVEGPLNLLWCRVIRLLMLLRLSRTRLGRGVVRQTAAPDLSRDHLDRIYRYVDDHPRAMLETAQLLRVLIPYFRQTRAALEDAALPDVPMRIISPQPRPSWPTQLAKIDAAHRDLIARFPSGQFVPAHGATHQWLPFERPDVVLDAVREVLALSR